MIDNKLQPNVYITQNIIPTYIQPTPQQTASFIGLFNRGTAFIPTLINKELKDVVCGDFNQLYFTKYAVDKYLQQKDSVIVTRIMHNSGWSLDVGKNILIKNAGGDVIGSLIATEGNTFVSATLSTDDVVITYNTDKTVTYSLIYSDDNYIGKKIGYNPKTNGVMYAQFLFDSILDESATFTVNSQIIKVSDSSINFKQPSTPYIIDKNGDKLFRLHHLSHGSNINKDVKITITDIRESNINQGRQWASFTLLVRKFDDTDQRPVVLQRFTNLTLNPQDNNFISNVIGDKYYQFIDNSIFNSYTTSKNAKLKQKGNYNNNSNYIRVQLSDNIVNGQINSQITPDGFEGLYNIVESDTHPYSFVTSNKIGTTQIIDTKIMGGFDFQNSDNLNYVSYVRDDSTKITNDYKMSEDTLTGLKGFSLPFQNGFDGIDPSIKLNNLQSMSSVNTLGFNFSTLQADDIPSLNIILTLLNNIQSINIQSVTFPGLSLQINQTACKLIEQMASKRGDCKVYFDLAKKGQYVVQSTLDYVFNSSYASSYYPYGKIKQGKKFVWLPSTCLLQQPIIATDVYSTKYDSIAGLNRGRIDDIVQLQFDLDTEQRTILQNKRVNPITMFDNVAYLWGNLTMQVTRPNEIIPTSRVNVRRALCQIKKFLTRQCRQVLFELHNDNFTSNLNNRVNPYFEQKLLTGKIKSFNFNSDTPDIILDQNAVTAKLSISFSNVIQKIFIDIEVSNTSSNIIQN